MLEGGVVTLDFTLLWQAFNIIVLYYLLRRFLYKPLSEFMENRRQKIQGDLKTSRESKEEAEKLKAQYEEKIRASQQEAQSIIDRAARKGEEIVNESAKDARKESEAILAKARQELEMEKEKAFRELQDQVALLSVRLAEKIIEKELDPASQSKLVKDYIDEVNQLS